VQGTDRQFTPLLTTHGVLRVSPLVHFEYFAVSSHVRPLPLLPLLLAIAAGGRVIQLKSLDAVLLQPNQYLQCNDANSNKANNNNNNNNKCYLFIRKSNTKIKKRREKESYKYTDTHTRMSATKRSNQQAKRRSERQMLQPRKT
jgi:hypothetical protein